MARDFAGTLARVAELGYSEVELAGYFDKSPAEVRRLLDASGLSSPDTHIQLAALRNNLQKEIDTAATIGQRYIVVPVVPESERSLDHYHRHAEFLNGGGELCKRAGLTVGYHNHSFEFDVTENQVHYDVLLDETDPSLVVMEMDLLWIRNADVNPVPYFEKYAGRFPMLNVKDMDANRSMVSVGQGTIDFSRLFSYVDTAGFQHYFVEHDNPGNGIESVSQSITAVRNLVF